MDVVTNSQRPTQECHITTTSAMTKLLLLEIFVVAVCQESPSGPEAEREVMAFNVVAVCQESSSGPEAEREVMAFKMKQKFFEQEIENAQQSRPSSAFQSTS